MVKWTSLEIKAVLDLTVDHKTAVRIITGLTRRYIPSDTPMACVTLIGSNCERCLCTHVFAVRRPPRGSTSSSTTPALLVLSARKHPKL
ncbi:hypothetical protein J6590_000283 [Homalodisca vitripennis]|nr:hypothetical protein J6590_000283 [Homalodisca vitripennis]